MGEVDRDAGRARARCRRGTPTRRHGEFLNDRRLSAAEKDDARSQWANAGAPEGNPADLPAAAATPKAGDRPARRRLAMQEDYPIPAERHHRVPVLRSPDQFHRGQVDSGVRSAAGQPRRRPSRDRLRAAAGRHRRRRCRRRTGGDSRPAGRRRCSRSPRDMDIPAGQTGGRRCRPISGNRADRTIGRRRRTHRPVDRRLTRPARSSRVYQDGTAMRLAGRLDADLPDALHDRRARRRPIGRASASCSRRRRRRPKLRVHRR